MILHCYTDDSKKRPFILMAIAFAAPNLGLALILGPIAVLSGIYAKHYGLSLASIASVMLVARLFDAISDPSVGYFSDRQCIRRGTRKPMILCGGLLILPCAQKK